MNYEQALGYLKTFWRWRAYFVLVFILVSTVITGGFYAMPKRYEANSTVFVEENIISDLVKGIAVSSDMTDRIRVLQYAMLSRGLIGKTLEEVDDDVVALNEAQLQERIADLQRKTEIKIRENKNLFIVSIRHKDPVFAQDFVNTLISLYMEENISAKREETYGANRFLDEQLKLFKERLDKAENAIIKFRKERGAFLQNDEKTLLQEIKRYSEELEEVELSIETLEGKRASVEQQLETIDETVDVYSQITEYQAQRVRIEQELKQLQSVYTDSYPKIIMLKSELIALDERESQNITQENEQKSTRLSSANPVYVETQQSYYELVAEIKSLEARRKKLNELMSAKKRELQSTPEYKKQLAVLVHERNSSMKIYQELLERVGKAEVSKQMEIGDKSTTFRVVDPAVLPTVPVFPNMVKMIIFATIAAFGAGAGATVLREQADRTIRSEVELEALKLPVLAVIPNASRNVPGTATGRLVLLLGFCHFAALMTLLGYEILKRTI